VRYTKKDTKSRWDQEGFSFTPKWEFYVREKYPKRPNVSV